jgi:bifunctional non-homologous end joining protein LigD
VQKHAASRLHYDFRLELDGTLKSWAVPKGPSLDPADKRMAVHVEDHPLDYGGFEGSIPAGHYGAGNVIVWDRGTWQPVGDARLAYAQGKLKFRLAGEKLAGGWTLVRMHGRAKERQEPWLLIKERDETARPAAEYSVVDAEPTSVLSGETVESIGGAKAPGQAPAKPAAKASAKVKAEAQAKAKATTPRSTATGAATKGSSRARPAASTPLPATFSPQLATLVSSAPADPGWLYEIKWDGYRILARVEGGRAALVTRNGHDWTGRMPGLAEAVAGLGLRSGWLDGEIVVFGADGAPDFNALQKAFDSSRTNDIHYCVFDLPYADGSDLRAEPLVARRERLERLVDAAPASVRERLRFSQAFDAAPSELLQTACRMRLEGVIGKRLDSPYVSRRSPSWIKLKCTARQEFVVGGWTDPKGSRTGVGSLLLGIHDEAGELQFAGAVGSGFDEATLVATRKRLDALAVPKPPFATRPKGVPGAHWVRPTLVAEVSFGEWTPDRKVRHAVFHGWRADKPAEAVTTEVAVPPESLPTRKPTQPAGKDTKATNAAEAAKAPSAAKQATPARRAKAADAEVGGVRVSHPERVVDASTGATKLDVVNHYLAVARRMLPHLDDRPVSLVRAPAGIGAHLFFQRHAETLKIPELKQLDPAISPDHKPMVEVDSFAALIGAAQANTIEFHTWNATTRDIGRPDRLVFDLDPGEGVAWSGIQEATMLVRTLLDGLGLPAFLKTSGGKGLHVVVPIAPDKGWDDAKEVSKRIVEHLAATLPERFVAKSGPKNRVGRIFVDYLRNGFGATTAAAWSARARPGLGVSVPCAWDELDTLTGGDHWTVASVGERLEEKVDPWAAYGKKKGSLAAAARTLG